MGEQRYQILIHNSVDFNIDLNAKDKKGNTAFITACLKWTPEVAEVLIDNSVDCNIDLNAKDNCNKTGFQLAKRFGNKTICKLIEKKMPKLCQNI